jgi:hypothetical protein
MTKPISTFRANGKLLLTGEYLVLQGALALAIPLAKGQTLELHHGDAGFLQWEAHHPGGLWMQAVWNDSLTLIQSSDADKAEWLTRIFRHLIEMKPGAKNKLFGFKVITRLEFDHRWGWGSSSTIISCLSQWLNIDGFKLLRQTIGGSGYDLACATAGEPIFYRLTKDGYEVEAADFFPEFAHKLWVVYLGNKADSSHAIAALPKNNNKALVQEITHLTHLMAGCTFGDAFASLMPIHEQLIGEYLGQKPVKQRLFPDFEGEIKSLGAWGGDFVLAYSNMDQAAVCSYFLNKGYQTMFNYHQIINR